MKQYLLIPIEEISKRISYLEREIDNNLGSVLADYDSHEKQILERLHQKGEIVEIENNELTDLFKEYSHSNTKQTFESFVVNEKGYKLIKITKQ